MIRRVGPIRLGSGWRAVLLLVAGVIGALALARGNDDGTAPAAKVRPPLVRVQTVKTETIVLVVRARGLVEPRTQSDLLAEVKGRVMRVSPALAVGGFFDAGDVLLEIDDRDYKSARKRALATQIRAGSEARLAASNLDRLRTLAGSRVTSRAALDEGEGRAEIARAAVLEGEAALEDADRNLERTLLRAPYDGRVAEKSVDVGQIVGPGKRVARLHAVDFAEVRLPISDSDLAYLDLSLGARSIETERPETGVILRALFAGEERRWRARIVRVEGQLDPRTRMLHLVARVDDPYARRSPGEFPLAMGLFVDAEIEGRTLEDVQRIPRVALRSDDEILVVDRSGRLRTRAIDVIRIDGASVIVRAGSGVGDGEFVCVSDQRSLVDGMTVRTHLEESPEERVANHLDPVAAEAL
jgi:RND family efflux transporter MFP subunit